MSDHSAIQWTDATWNPTTGCTKVSPGCANCYIERTPAFRIPGRRFVKGHIPLTLHNDRVEQPLHWRKPRRVFVNSLSDLFHADVPDEMIARVFAAMSLCPQHQFQVLTKRPERMQQLLSAPSFRDWWQRIAQRFHGTPYEPAAWPLPNVWLGVSVENQHFADERIPLLLQTPASVRFISAEPLLGTVKLDHMDVERIAGDAGYYFINALTGRNDDMGRPCHDVPKLDWVIVGGESGPGARPFDLACGRSLVRQCRDHGVACFVKQLGSRPYASVSPDWSWNPAGVQDSKGGDPTEWPDDLRVREFPQMRENGK